VLIFLQCGAKQTSKQIGSRVQQSAMKRNGKIRNGRLSNNQTTAAMERMELYCATYPDSPSAVRRPRLMVRDQLWIALLGPSVEEGIIGIGPSVESALRAFDMQYFAGVRPRAAKLGGHGAFGGTELSAA
jgi:hypothetical protein